MTKRKAFSIIIGLFLILTNVELVVGGDISENNENDLDNFLKEYSISYYKCPAEKYVLTDEELSKAGWTKLEYSLRPTQIEEYSIPDYKCYASGKLIKGDKVYIYVFVVFQDAEEAKARYSRWKNSVLTKVENGETYFELIRKRTFGESSDPFSTYITEGFKYYHKDPIFGLTEGDVHTVILSHNAIIYVYGNENWLEWEDTTDDAARTIAAKAGVLGKIEAYLEYSKMKVAQYEKNYPEINFKKAEEEIEEAERLIESITNILDVDIEDVVFMALKPYITATKTIEEYKIAKFWIDKTEKLYQNVTELIGLAEERGVVIPPELYEDFNTAKDALTTAKTKLEAGDYEKADEYVEMSLKQLNRTVNNLNSLLKDWKKAKSILTKIKVDNYNVILAKIDKLQQKGVVIPKDITTIVNSTKTQIQELENKFENGEYSVVYEEASQLRDNLYGIQQELDNLEKMFDRSKTRIIEAEKYMNETKSKYPGIVLGEAEEKLQEAKEYFEQGYYKEAEISSGRAIYLTKKIEEEYLKANETLKEIKNVFEDLQETYNKYYSKGLISQDIIDEYSKCQQNLSSVLELFETGDYSNVTKLAPSVNECIVKCKS